MPRYCLGGEEIASFVSMAVIVPTLIGAAIAVQLCKKYDKFKIFYFSYMFALILGIVRYIAGYENMMVYVILNALGGFPLGIAAILQYQFTPDCYEYGQYKTGLKMRGVTFAAPDVLYQTERCDRNRRQRFCPDSDRFQMKMRASFRRQDLPINCGPSAALAASLGGSARCSSCACTNSTTMMFSSCPSATMVRSPARKRKHR